MPYIWINPWHSSLQYCTKCACGSCMCGWWIEGGMCFLHMIVIEVPTPVLLLRMTLLPQRSIKECTLETSSLCEHSSKVMLLMYAFNSHTPPIPNLYMYLLIPQGRMARDLETMILVKKVDGIHQARYVQQLCSNQLREGEPTWCTCMH